MKTNRYFLILILLAGLPLLALRHSPAAELPPRPPTATPVLGAQIILALPDAATASPAWWTVVQWQDDNGRLHDVTGWQGAFDATGRVVWWVGPEHLGTGPFRWVIYESVDRAREVARSEPFHLPKRNLEQLEIRPVFPTR